MPVRKPSKQPKSKKTKRNPKGAGRKLFDGQNEEIVVKKLEEAFAIGCTDKEACLYADISERTLYTYQEKHPEFAQRKELLKERPVLTARNTVVKALQTDADIALKYLERRKSDEFATKSKQEHSGEIKGGGFNIVITEKQNDNGELGANKKAGGSVENPQR